MYCEKCECLLSSKSLIPISVDGIFAAASSFFGVKKTLLISKTRTQQLVDARFMCIMVIRERLRLPVKRIGQLFERDHTSVLHALKTVQNLCHTDEQYKHQYQRFKQYIDNQNQTK